MDPFRTVLSESLKKKIPAFGPGDTVRVYVKIKEQDRERLQPFEGIVIRRRGEGMGASFTVRKISYGVGVERIFPLHAPVVDRIEILAKGRVRRAKLYYLRGRTGKRSRVASEATRSEEASGWESRGGSSPTSGAGDTAPSPASTK